MDPNETLKRIRELVRAIRISNDDEAIEDLTETFDSLDAWLISGGFLPEDWKPIP
jgi:ribosome assembly protein YihI (activator of Der GTPase)